MNVATKYAAIALLLSGAAGCGDLESDETVDEAKVVEPTGGGTSTAALSGANDGKYPSSVSGCSSNVHIPKDNWNSNRIKASNQYGERDYGWWEWRYSSTGSCKGYQWVRLHIEHDMPFTGTYLSTRYWRTDAPSTFIYTAVKPSIVNGTVGSGMWETTASFLLANTTYDSQILYSPTVQSCADMASDLAILGNWDFWAYAAIAAHICA